jgi:hypothetical protein
MALSLSIALGSVFAASAPVQATPTIQPTISDRSNIVQARVDDRPPYTWNQRGHRGWRGDRRDWRNSRWDNRRHWRGDRWDRDRDRDWRRHHRRGGSIILDF